MTPEERANAIRLWSKWTTEKGDERTWDDVRSDIADAIRAAEQEAYERGAQAMQEYVSENLPSAFADHVRQLPLPDYTP